VPVAAASAGPIGSAVQMAAHDCTCDAACAEDGAAARCPAGLPQANAASRSTQRAMAGRLHLAEHRHETQGCSIQCGACKPDTPPRRTNRSTCGCHAAPCAYGIRPVGATRRHQACLFLSLAHPHLDAAEYFPHGSDFVPHRRATGVLWQAPHTLPPHLLVGMLQNPDEVARARLWVRKEAVCVLGADHAEPLSRLLATESLGVFAADRLWKVAPGAAARLLEAAPGDHAPASLRLLILSAPPERTGSVARAILSRDGLLSESERIDWARQRLCACGAHAEMLAQILDLDINTRPWTTSSQRR